MKIVTTEFICDRCKGPLKKECGLIIENMSFQASGYDPRGSGGAGHKEIEFCYDCSRQFYEWVFGRSNALPPQPNPIRQEKDGRFQD